MISPALAATWSIGARSCRSRWAGITWSRTHLVESRRRRCRDEHTARRARAPHDERARRGALRARPGALWSATRFRRTRRCAGRVLLVAAGKAAIAMARGALGRWPDRIDEALVDHDRITARSRVARRVLARLRGCTGAHPIPDTRSEAAADEALRRAARLGPEDLLLGLILGRSLGRDGRARRGREPRREARRRSRRCSIAARPSAT
ncbi:MAG: DUF4147 domain-containing protein [Cypionkella sp.]